MESQTQPMAEELVRRFNTEGIVFGRIREIDEWPDDTSTPTTYSIGNNLIQPGNTQMDKTEGFWSYQTKTIEQNILQNSLGNLLPKESVDLHHPVSKVLMNSPLSLGTAKPFNSGMLVIDVNQDDDQPQAIMVMKHQGYRSSEEHYSQMALAPELSFQGFWRVPPKGVMKYMSAVIAEYSHEYREEVSITRSISRQLVDEALAFSKSYLNEGFEREFNYLLPVFSLRNQEEVKSFLVEHPSLISVLRETQIEIRHFFPQAQIFLEVVSDPEDSAIVQLGILIRSDLNPEAVYQQLQEFEENWWLDNLDRAKGAILVNLEFL